MQRNDRLIRRVIWCWLLLVGLGAGVTAHGAPALGDSVMVVSANPLATQVGVEVLRDGGNAADAAVAVAFALAVVEPYSSGIGGGGFVVLFDAGSGTVRTVDCRETAPAAAHRDMYLRGGEVDPRLSLTGGLAVGVPGLVRGLWELHQQAGCLSWQRLLAPAVAMAADGFSVYPMLHENIADEAERFNKAARAVLMPGGSLPPVGTLLRQTDLAATLAAIADEGPDPFYTGAIAEAIVRTIDGAGGLLSHTDFVDYQVKWREPIAGSYRGLTVYSMPPPSSGGVHLVEMLNILEGFDLGTLGFGSAAATHLLVEAMKFAYADRSRFLGDADFVAVPVARLTSRDYADQLRQRIRADRALPTDAVTGVEVVPEESDQTTHLSVIDAAGNAVAATLTINIGFGSGLMAAGTGVILNDEMDDFAAAPGVPNYFGLIGSEANAIAPGKRPLSSMTPTIVVEDGRVCMVTGTPGGSKIITTTLQTIINVFDHGMDVQQALNAPRIHHQWYPRHVYFEAFGMSPDTQALLTARGHSLQRRSPICNAQAIVVDTQTGLRYGASDPRGCGSAAGF